MQIKLRILNRSQQTKNQDQAHRFHAIVLIVAVFTFFLQEVPQKLPSRAWPCKDKISQTPFSSDFIAFLFYKHFFVG